MYGSFHQFVRNILPDWISCTDLGKTISHFLRTLCDKR